VTSSEIAKAPAARQPAARQPAARQPAAPQPAAPQPGAPQSPAPQPAAPEPPASAPAGDPPPSRRFLIFGVTAIALFMASIDQTIVSTALGTLQHDLHAAINWVSWTITVYALGQIVAMPVAGALSDIYAIGTALLAFPAGGVSPYAWLAIAAGVTGIGTGVSLPASNNATLQLAPAKAASISGLRGMFRQAGGITGISIASALVARSSHPGLTQAAMFAVLAVIMVLLIPLTFLVPEHRGTW
jgi:MFS family permease